MIISQEKLALIKQDTLDTLDYIFGIFYIYRKIRRGIWVKYKDSLIFKDQKITYFEWIRNSNAKSFSFMDFFYREIIKKENHDKK